jgi:hypothetical protein
VFDITNCMFFMAWIQGFHPSVHEILALKRGVGHVENCDEVHFATFCFDFVKYHSTLAAWTLIILFSAAPHCAFSAFLGVVFCLDFSPFFFLLLLFPCQVFFLYLFQEWNFTNRQFLLMAKKRCFLGFLVTKFRNFLFNFFPDFCIKFQ